MKKMFLILFLFAFLLNKSHATECMFELKSYDNVTVGSVAGTLPNFLFEGFDIPRNLKTADGKPLIEVNIPPIILNTSATPSSSLTCSSVANTSTLSVADVLSAESTVCKICLIKAFNVFTLPGNTVDTRSFTFPSGKLEWRDNSWKFNGEETDMFSELTLELDGLHLVPAIKISSVVVQTLPNAVANYMQKIWDHNIGTPLNTFLTSLSIPQ